jgi:hypothetical protein
MSFNKGDFCRKFNQEYDRAQHVLDRFNSHLDEAAKQGNVSVLESLQVEFEESYREVNERMYEMLDALFHLREVYAEQQRLYKDIGILKELPTGELYIEDGQGRKWEMLSLESVQERLLEKWPKVQRKAEQGFTRLAIVPFALPIREYANALNRLLVQRKNNGGVYEQTGDPSHQQEENRLPIREHVSPLDPEDKSPLRVFKGWSKEDEVFYYPQLYGHENHGGKTKEQLLESRQTKGAWSVVLFQEDPYLVMTTPREPLGGRSPLPLERSPEHYLDLLRQAQADPSRPYAHEQFSTLEEYLILVMTHLHKTGELLDCVRDPGDRNSLRSSTLNLGTYHPDEKSVPYIKWDASDRQVSISYEGVLMSSQPRRGIRTIVDI